MRTNQSGVNRIAGVYNIYTQREFFTAKDARKFKFSRRVLEIDAMVAKERS